MKCAKHGVLPNAQLCCVLSYGIGEAAAAHSKPCVLLIRLLPCLPCASAPQSAPELFKLKALSNLIELLRADEEHMMAAQQVQQWGRHSRSEQQY